MNYFKRMKTIFLTTCLILGLSLFIPINVSAATYTVIRGDTLYKISQIFSTTVSTLMKENNLSTSTINIGQVLNVHSKTYTVQKGDTLYLISQKFKISLTSLRRANNIYTDYIYIGQILNIPGVPEDTSTIPPTTTPTNPPASAITYTESDLDLLARLITAEAQGEPYDAKVAVGAVVVNRAKSGLFPSTISGVIYQNINGYYQFTPVVNGWIDYPADSDSINAAKTALSGVDPTNGALFYYDDSTTNAWILSKPVSVKIGHMVFAY